MTKKVVINACYGGFGLSKEAIDEYAKRKGIALGKWNSTWKFYEEMSDRRIARDDADLVDIVESMGEKSYGWAAELKVVEIPEDVEWEIQEYDGSEWVAEVHRTWR